MTEFIIETNQLYKSFKSQPALRGLDLRVPAGSVFGFLSVVMAQVRRPPSRL